MKIVLIVGASALQLEAQTDSLKKRQPWLSGIQVDMAFLGNSFSQTGQQQLQGFVKTNTILNADVTGYKKSEGYDGFEYNSYLSVRAFKTIPTKAKRLHLEAVAGIRLGGSTQASADYYRQTYDTTGVYVNAATNQSITTVTEHNESYGYQVRSQHVLVPLGVNITTSRARWFWFSAGIELMPGISYSNVLTATNSKYKSELTLTQSSNLNDYGSYSSNGYENETFTSESSKLKGIGFMGYASVPLSVNLRFAKRARFLKHMSASASVAPSVYVRKSKYGSNNGFVFNTALGLRYSFN